MAAELVSLIRREMGVVMLYSSHLFTESCSPGNAANRAGHIHRLLM